MPDPEPFVPSLPHQHTRVEPFPHVDQEPNPAEVRERLLQQQLEEERRQREFHAQECSVLAKPPFQPKAAPRGLVEVSPFELNTQKRAYQREGFEERKRQRQQELDEEEAARKRQALAEEEAELRRLRKELVSKANPVRHYAAVEVRASDKKLTEPMSPAWVHKSMRV